MLRFPNSPPAAKSASTTSSSSSDSDSDSSNSSIYQEDDDYHSIESEEPVDYNTSRVTRDTTYPAHVCMAGSESATSSAERRTIGVSQAVWDRVKDAVERSIVLPPGASQEELQAYHYLLSHRATTRSSQRRVAVHCRPAGVEVMVEQHNHFNVLASPTPPVPAPRATSPTYRNHHHNYTVPVPRDQGGDRKSVV